MRPPFPGMDLGNGFLSSLVAPRVAGGASRSVGATQPAHRTSWARFPSFPGTVFRPPSCSPLWRLPCPGDQQAMSSLGSLFRLRIGARGDSRKCHAQRRYGGIQRHSSREAWRGRTRGRRRGRTGSPRSVDGELSRGRGFRSLRPQACARGRRTGRGPPIPAPETEAFEEFHPCERCRPPPGGSSSPRRGMPERGPFAFSIPSPLMSASRASCGGRGGRAGAFLRPPRPDGAFRPRPFAGIPGNPG